jgi:hypothetical protein
MLKTKKPKAKETTNNLLILFACQVGFTADGESKFSEMVYKGFINQLNEKQGNVPLIDYQFLKNLDPRISVRQDTRQ